MFTDLRSTPFEVEFTAQRAEESPMDSSFLHSPRAMRKMYRPFTI